MSLAMEVLVMFAIFFAYGSSQGLRAPRPPTADAITVNCYAMPTCPEGFTAISASLAAAGDVSVTRCGQAVACRQQRSRAESIPGSGPTSQPGLVGGLGPVQWADPAVTALCRAVQRAIMAQAARAGLVVTGPQMFRPVSFRSQVVAGTNYFVKIQVGLNEYLHARLFQPLPYTGAGPEAVAVRIGLGLRDPIAPF